MDRFPGGALHSLEVTQQLFYKTLGGVLRDCLLSGPEDRQIDDCHSPGFLQVGGCCCGNPQGQAATEVPRGGGGAQPLDSASRVTPAGGRERRRPVAWEVTAQVLQGHSHHVTRILPPRRTSGYHLYTSAAFRLWVGPPFSRL